MATFLVQVMNFTHLLLLIFFVFLISYVHGEVFLPGYHFVSSILSLELQNRVQ